VATGDPVLPFLHISTFVTFDLLPPSHYPEATSIKGGSIMDKAVFAKAGADSEGSGLIGTMIMGWIASLHLTDQQKVELKRVLKAHRPTLQPLVTQYVSERRALRGLMGSKQIDEAAIRAQVAKVAAIGADLAVERAHLKQEFRGILTPEQISKIGKMRAKRDAGVDRLLTWAVGTAE
jgi:Spy/CpxP family protein refolding chaperone